MAVKAKLAAMLVLTVVVGLSSNSSANNVFFDDFEDGNAEDGQPLTWEKTSFGAGTFEVVDGKLVAVPTDRYTLVGVTDTPIENGSIRAHVKKLDPSEDGDLFFEMYLRGDTSIGSAYYGGFTDYGAVYLRRPGGVLLARAETDLPPLEEDIQVQFDLFDEMLSLWAWRAGEAMPTEPLIVAEDVVIDEGSEFAFAFGSIDSDSSERRVAIEYIQVADFHITTGDYNSNGALDIGDIDVQAIALRNPAASVDRYDLNNDRTLDFEDRTTLIHREFGTWIGDSNLDGEFNSGDFVSVFQAGEYEDGVENNSTWATGDWNGDLEFSSGDFVLAFQDGGFEQGIANVPEPKGIALAAVAVAVLPMLRQRR